MSAEQEEPFANHATRYLDRFREIIKQYRADKSDIQPLILALGKLWPQIVAGFSWASGSGSVSQEANRIAKSFVKPDEVRRLTDISRTPGELTSWAEAAEVNAERHGHSIAGVAMLGQFACVARVEADLFQIADETRVNISEVLRLAGMSLDATNHGVE